MHQCQEPLPRSLFGELRPRSTLMYPGSALQNLFIPNSHLTTPPSGFQAATGTMKNREAMQFYCGENTASEPSRAECHP